MILKGTVCKGDYIMKKKLIALLVLIIGIVTLSFSGCSNKNKSLFDFDEFEDI